MKSNEVLIPFATWMDLENMILCERNQSQKDPIFYDFICVNQKDQIYKDKRKSAADLGRK